MCIHVCINRSTCMHIDLFMYVWIYVCILYACLYVCIYVRMHEYMYACRFVCIHVYIHMYVHKHNIILSALILHSCSVKVRIDIHRSKLNPKQTVPVYTLWGRLVQLPASCTYQVAPPAGRRCDTPYRGQWGVRQVCREGRPSTRHPGHQRTVGSGVCVYVCGGEGGNIVQA